MMHSYQYLYGHDDEREENTKPMLTEKNHPKFFNCTKTIPDFTKFDINCERYGKQKMRANLTRSLMISISIHLNGTTC